MEIKKEFLVDLLCSVFQMGERDLEKVYEVIRHSDDRFYKKFMSEVVPSIFREEPYLLDLVAHTYIALRDDALDELNDIVIELLEMDEMMSENEKENFMEELYESQGDCMVFGNYSDTQYDCENLKNFLNRVKIMDMIKQYGFKPSKTVKKFLSLIEV